MSRAGDCKKEQCLRVINLKGVKLVYAAAIKANSSSLILAHCHPSGNLLASEQDKRLTQRIKKAGEILYIPVLDHLIMTAEGYYSFADDGEL